MAPHSLQYLNAQHSCKFLIVIFHFEASHSFQPYWIRTKNKDFYVFADDFDVYLLYKKISFRATLTSKEIYKISCFYLH